MIPRLQMLNVAVLVPTCMVEQCTDWALDFKLRRSGVQAKGGGGGGGNQGFKLYCT